VLAGSFNIAAGVKGRAFRTTVDYGGATGGPVNSSVLFDIVGLRVGNTDLQRNVLNAATTLRSVGPHAIGGVASTNLQVGILGAFTGSTNTRGLSVGSTLTGTPGNDITGLIVGPTLVEAASGVHSLLAAVAISGFTITNGAATATDAAGLYMDTFAAPAGTTNASTIKIEGAPTGASNNYALWVKAGEARIGGVLNITSGGSTTISTGVGSVRMSTVNAATNTAWIPIQYAGTTYYVPGWTTNAP
jgi:hypothetical protein